MTERGTANYPLISIFIVFPVLLLGIVFLIPHLIPATSSEVLIPLNFVAFDLTVTDLLFATGFLFVLAVTLAVYFFLYAHYRADDIAEGKTEELLRSRDFFLSLFDDSPVPYVMVDKEATIILPNKAAQHLFQMDTQELSQFRFYDLIDQTDYSEAETMREKFKRGVASPDTEVRVIRKDGSVRWVRMVALPYRALGGTNKGGTVSMLDVTEQKAIDKVKTEFVSLASHQLRTPLSAMKWYSEMILNSKEPLSEKQRTHLEKIYRGNERMIELVNLLLSASRLELGSLRIDIAQVDPIPIVKDILEEVSLKIREKGLHVVEQYSGDNTQFHTDRKLITMVLQNLITNAVKYTDDGGEIRIVLGFSANNLKIEVADNGMGIPAEERDKIFTKMFRAENARLKVTDGTGLGLYIVKEAITALGGQIGFTSELNEGTIFTANIPNGTA